jgi:hypothetical protein
MECLEGRQLLSSTTVTATTGPTNVSTADNFYSTALGPGFVLLQNQTLSVPAFDTQGGTRVLTAVKVEYRVDLIQEFLDYEFDAGTQTFTVDQGITFVNNDPFSSVSLSGSANATANLSVTEPGLGAADIPTLGVTTAVAVDSDPNTAGNQPFTVGPAIAVGTPTTGTFLGGDSDSNPDPDLVSTPPNEAAKQFSTLNLTAPAQLAAFVSSAGDTTVSFGVNVTGSTNLVIQGSANFVQNGALTTVERGELRVTYIFGVPQLKIEIAPDATNEVGDPHTFTTTVMQDDGLSATEGGDNTDGFVVSTVGNVDVTLTDSNGAASVLDAGNSTSDDNQPTGDNLDDNGQATTTFTSATAGQVTGHATAAVTVLGLPLTVETDGVGDNSDDAVKTFVDANITIAPDAVNPVGAPHTFTVTVNVNDGSGGGFVPATVGNVDVTLTDAGGAVSVVDAANSTADDNQPTGDNLDGSGQATITFTSFTAGTVTGNAAVSVVVGGVTLVRDTDPATAAIGAGPGGSGPAVKTFEVINGGGEGLTPGFWKQNATFRSKVTGNIGEAWLDAGFTPPGVSLSTLFTSLAGTQYASLNMLQGLSLSGGGIQALIRHAVAGILNASHPGIEYDLTVDDIKTAVNAAILGGNAATIEDLKDDLDGFNNLGADVDQHGRFTP